ncbi:hypothetical protein DRJ19_04795 [Candidatus Woesearchaeota archaeon]|nr:MAG: hypothetical protein DRJ19_04795 [Candidatus Woesearchaeota archaeon]
MDPISYNLARRAILEKPIPPYSAIVRKDENTVWAKDPEGKTIASGKAGVDDGGVIHSAINNCLQGTIVIAKGEYNIKGIAIRIEGDCKNLRLIGYGATLKATDSGHNLITIQKGDNATKPENIVVEGFYLDGTPDMHAISIQGGKNVIVKNCFITNAYTAGVEVTHYLGECSEDIKIIKNKIINCGGMGIYIGTGDTAYTRRVIIEDNIIDTTGVSDYVDKDGIFIDGGYDVSVRSNKIYNAGGQGIGLYGYADVVNIEDNTIVNAAGAGIRGGNTEYTSCKIIHNKISGCLRGIALTHTVANTVVEDNRIKDSTEHGILVNLYGSGETLHNIKLLYNIISGCGKQGIRVSGYHPDAAAEDIDVIGNTIKDCSLESAGGYDGIQFNFVQHGKIERNRISGANHRYNVRTENASDYVDIVLNELGDYHTGQLSVVGLNNIIRQNRGYTTENSGTATFDGDGTTTDFSIGAHGLVTSDSSKIAVKVTPVSQDAINASPCVGYVDPADNTKIRVKFASPPASGSENVKIVWYAEVIS